jgi:hypothetical protein
MGAAMGAVAAVWDMLLLDCSVFDCLLHAAVSSKPHETAATDIQLVFLFMMSFFLWL